MDGLIKPEEMENAGSTEASAPAANDQPQPLPAWQRIEPAPVPGPGAVLRAEREAKGFSIEEVAQALKLAPRQLEAIESDQFEAFRGQTFARGFVKNYAKLLHLDPEPLLARMQASAPASVQLEPPSNTGGPVPLSSGTQGPIVAGGLAVLALAIVAVVGSYGEWGSDKTKTSNVAAPALGAAADAARRPVAAAPAATTPASGVVAQASQAQLSGAQLYPPGWTPEQGGAPATPTTQAAPVTAAAAIEWSAANGGANATSGAAKAGSSMAAHPASATVATASAATVAPRATSALTGVTPAVAAPAPVAATRPASATVAGPSASALASASTGAAPNASANTNANSARVAAITGWSAASASTSTAAAPVAKPAAAAPATAAAPARASAATSATGARGTAGAPIISSYSERAGATDAQAASRSGDLTLSRSLNRARAEKRVVLRFEDEAWVQVRDAEGRVVFSQLSPAGATRVVDAKPPLSLVVGNAKNVKMSVDDKPFDITPHIGVTVARFSVE